MSDYKSTVEDITVVDGVSMDITVRGDEDKAEKLLMDLKERAGVVGAAFEKQTPPEELDEIPDKYVPLMSVAWDRVFSDE